MTCPERSKLLRFRCQAVAGLCGSQLLRMCGRDASGGADISEISFLILDPVEKELVPQVSFIYDGTAGQENPWRIRYGIDEAEEPAT